MSISEPQNEIKHIPQVAPGAKKFTALLLDKRQLTHKIYELVLKLEEPQSITFKAGQFVMLYVKGETKRSYSIISTPKTLGNLEFCIDISPMGPGSIFTLDLKVGDKVMLEGPLGLFTVKNWQRDLLFVATGAGVAPFKSIISDLLDNGFQKNIALVFGVHSEENIFYFDYFEQLASKHQNFKFYPAVSQPKGDWQGITGRVTAFLEKNFEFFDGCQMFICGSAPMIKDVRAIAIQKGVSPLDIKIEVFT